MIDGVSHRGSDWKEIVMTGFFLARNATKEGGLVLFLNAGDPSFDTLERVLMDLDRARVDCVELAVPFPDSVTDGPTIRRSADRALAAGADLDAVLAFTARIRPRLSHLKIALLADWSYTVRPQGLQRFLEQTRDCGSDAVLVHGLPPRMTDQYYTIAHDIGLPVVTTCYAQSGDDILEKAARHSTAYVYLVAHYGRTGTTPTEGYGALKPVIDTLRMRGSGPVAVGFGVKTRAHIREIGLAGADAAIVGSASAARIEAAVDAGRDVAADLRDFVAGLQGHDGDAADDERAAIAHTSPTGLSS